MKFSGVQSSGSIYLICSPFASSCILPVLFQVFQLRIHRLFLHGNPLLRDVDICTKNRCRLPRTCKFCIYLVSFRPPFNMSAICSYATTFAVSFPTNVSPSFAWIPSHISITFKTFRICLYDSSLQSNLLQVDVP